MKKLFPRILAVMLVCLFAISGFNFSILAVETATTNETLSAMNIGISGKISLMFYFTNMNGVSGFKVTVGSGEVSVVDKSELKYDSAKDRYLLSVPLAAAQQADLVTVQAINDSGVASSTVRQYSVAQYATKLFALTNANPSNTTYAAAAEAVKAMLNYGAMAQEYFVYNTDSLANDGLYYRETNPVTGMDYEDLLGITDASLGTAPAALSISGVEAFLEDTVSLRFYISCSGDINNVKVSIQGSEVENQILQDENNNYYVLINNIPATLFNKQYTVKVSSGSTSHTVSYSVLNYLQDKLANASSQSDLELMNTAYAMYLFYVWANEYKSAGSVITDERSGACLHGRTYIDNVIDEDQDGTLDRRIFCSDCGELRGAAGWFEVSGTTVSSHSGSLDSNGNLVTTDISYTASGFDGYDEDKGLYIPAGTSMTLSGSVFNNLGESFNRYHLNCNASAPVKITVTYDYSQSNDYVKVHSWFGTSDSGSDASTTASGATDDFYVEAGEDIFSAVFSRFLNTTSSKTSGSYEYTYTHKYTITGISSIAVTPLTDEDTYFVMFNCETSTVSLDDVTTVSYTNSNGDSISAQMSYIQKTDAYKLGVSLSWGGTIAELYDLDANETVTSGTITSSSNLVNNFDTGRLIQQSYYGTFGDSGDGYEPRYYNVTGTPSRWNYNPVQAGDMSQNAARVIDYEKGTDYYGNPYIYIKILPRDWACQDSSGNEYNDGGRYTKCYLENRYTITDSYVKVDNRLVEFSDYIHHVTHQELPAFYTLSDFDDFYWYNGTSPWTDAALTREDNVPFWGYQEYVDDTTFTFQMSNTETWGAWIDETSSYGIGLYIPNVDQIKGGQSETKGTTVTTQTTDSASTYTSYFMAAKSLKITSYVPIEYSYLICAGDVSDIRSTFKANKDFASNYSLNDNSVSLRAPDAAIDMTSIDFTDKSNMPYMQSANMLFLSYAGEDNGVKVVTDGDDSYFCIDYTTFDGNYSADNYSCIAVDYMIPANASLYPNGVANVNMYIWLGDTYDATGFGNYLPGDVLVADGQWHTLRIYTADISSKALWSDTATVTSWTGQIQVLRFDLLNDGITSGQEMYIKSVRLTDDVETNVNNEYVTNLNIGYTGSALVSQITDGQWDPAGAFGAIVIDDDYVRVTSSSSVADRYFGLIPGGSTVTGQYMVVRYRTFDTPTSGGMNVFATANTTEISGSGDVFTAYGLVGDGRWHTLVIDLTASTKVTQTNSKYYLNQVRLDIFNALPAGAVVDFAYIGFCDSLSDVKVPDGEYVSYASDVWTIAIDSLTIDGSSVLSASGKDHATGATYADTIGGNVLGFGGWFAVANQDITDVSYCVVDEGGVEHWTALPFDNQSGFELNVHGWYTGEEGVQNAVAAYNATGYRLYANIDLEEYSGQTVHVSIRAITSDGREVVLLAADVLVLEYTSVTATWNFNVDSLLYATASDYSDIAAESGTANSTTTESPISTLSAKYLMLSNQTDWTHGGWVAVHGYDLSGMTYAVYSSSDLLQSGPCTLTTAESGVQDAAASLGYTDFVAYRAQSGVIDLSGYSGQTVTVKFLVTLKNVNTDPVVVLSVTVNVP